MARADGESKPLRSYLMAKKTKEELEWQAREDLQTLRNAEEIRKDRKRAVAAEKEAKKQIDALAQVANRPIVVKKKKTKKAKRPTKK